MNIMELAIGDECEANGRRYTILRDQVVKRPIFGKVTERTARDQDGRICKFIRGIDVRLLPRHEQQESTK